MPVVVDVWIWDPATVESQIVSLLLLEFLQHDAAHTELREGGQDVVLGVAPPALGGLPPHRPAAQAPQGGPGSWPTKRPRCATAQQKKALIRLLVKELRVMSRKDIRPTY